MTATTVAPGRWGLPRLGGLPWVTWRQHRLAIAGLAVVFGGVSIFLLFNGLAMHHAYVKTGLSSCGNPNGASCQIPLDIFSSKYENWAQLTPRFLAFLPIATGIFIGAPMVAREIETGTFRFAWTQGRNRVQWITVKMVLVGIVLVVMSLAFSAVFTWWFTPWDSLMGRMTSGQAYETEGIVFAARTTFALTLGALLGTLIRRTLPAMAATIAAWLAVVWPATVYLRPLIMKPIVVSASTQIDVSRTWTIDDWYQDRAGHRLKAYQMDQLVQQARQDGVRSRKDLAHWMTQRHYTERISYQPGNRFWHFQTVEASGYVVLTLLLAGATIWWLQHRTV